MRLDCFLSREVLERLLRILRVLSATKVHIPNQGSKQYHQNTPSTANKKKNKGGFLPILTVLRMRRPTGYLAHTSVIHLDLSASDQKSTVPLAVRGWSLAPQHYQGSKKKERNRKQKRSLIPWRFFLQVLALPAV